MDMNWILENWMLIMGIIGHAVLIGSAIVAATPSLKDDAFWAKVIKVVDWVSVINPKAPKV